MAGENTKYMDDPLESVPVYQAPQAKPMQFYVPLPVFAAEAVIMLGLFRFFGFWMLFFIVPIHILLMMKTSVDPWWVEKLTADFSHRFMIKNKGQRGKRVVTFTPHVTRSEMTKMARDEKKDANRKIKNA